MSSGEIILTSIALTIVVVVAWNIWRGHPHPPLSDKDRRDFDDAGEW